MGSALELRAALAPVAAVQAAGDAGHEPMRLALAGGGTGGHLVPGLHLLDELEGRQRTLGDLLWLHGERAVEERVLAGLERRVRPLPCERVRLALEPRSGGAPRPAGTCLRMPPAILSARRALLAHGSEVVLGLGGFVSVPAILAAKSLGLPVAVLEVNAVPGRATRALAPLCARVFHAWRGSLPRRASSRDRLVGPPLSSAFASPAGERERESARARLGFAPDRALLLVLGGSQGAGALNTFVRDALERLLASGLEVLHQVGPGRTAEAAAPRAGYRAVEYLDDVPAALRAAELVLCRGGASTLAEVAALGVPACVVPYPHHRDRHQEKNAAELGAGAIVIAERALGPDLADRLARLAAPGATDERERMRAAARASVPRDGARRIVEELGELARTLRWKRSGRRSGMGP